MKYPLSKSLKESDTTEEIVFAQRRMIVKSLGLAGLMAPFSPQLLAQRCQSQAFENLEETPNSLHQISHYNNYYEFSTNKKAVAILAKNFPTSPWSLKISGEVKQEKTLDLDSVLKLNPVERIYRFRCVEGWSMVIPWMGIPLCNVLNQVQLTSNAKYVQFFSKVDEDSMIGLDRTGLSFPYQEGLRIDEAMHPLTLLATGLYGKDLPTQNGAPLRLVVPWKYGFKGGKAIVEIRLTEKQPQTSWNFSSPSEYGFYANVNPKISHPRWSQRKENRIGELKKRKTLMFNGYAEQVASMYQGMDLKQFF